ncbi:protein kinase family protein [Lapillicoccus sp.]|uniref:protein kinase family protein n=1 Tax=Lapillicoccus sp. TaxID=1909287 RepID=UPI003266921E
MQGVGPGSVLGGRYLVQRRVSQHARYERWSAADQTLERDVVLVCFQAEGPVGSATLDAARRAAGVEDHRLVRVLDVGRDGNLTFVVEEPMPGARSMTAVLGDGGLPSEEARRVVGEAAGALESARARGLHHGALTPRSVLRLADGTIKVRGLATEAALLQADDTSSEAASRGDTVALVGLAYAVMTGRWPLAEGDSGLEAAPRVSGGVAAPSEIAAGVPADLDLLARTTLNEDHGPATPGELAEQIGPWSPVPVLGVMTPKQGPGTRTDAFPRDPVTGGLAHPAPTTSVRGAAAAAAAGVGAGATAGAAGRTTSRAARPSVLGMGLGGRRPSASNADPAVDPLVGSTAELASGADGQGADELDGLENGGPAGSARAAAVGTAIAAGAAGVAAGTAAAARRVGTAFGVVGDRMGDLARTAADRTAERSAARAERREAEDLEDPLSYGEDVRLSDTLETTDEPLGLGLPLALLPGTATEPLDRDSSRWVIAAVAVFVLVAAVLGVWGLPKLSGIGAGTAAAPLVTRTVTATPSASATATGAPAPAPTTPAPGGQPIVIVGSSQLDLDAGGVPQSTTSAAAYDGNPATAWSSSKWYATANFGGYKKAGLGLVLDLGQPTDVHRVSVTVPGPADVSIYVATRPALDGATQIGSLPAQNGPGTVTVPGGGSAKGNLVIVWFTTLGPAEQGRFRAQVSEVSVS